MLSYPDYSHKQIVVIMAEEYKKLSLESDTILIKDEHDTLVTKHSCHKIFCLMVIGDISVTTKLIEELSKHQIALVVLSAYNLKTKTVIGHPLEGNYLLRSKQYLMDPSAQLILARALVTQKITHQRYLLNQLRNKSQELKQAIKQIDDILKKIDLTQTPDSLRGLEGGVSKIFFAQYFDEIGRYKRLPKTKADILNMLMDIGYTFLFHMVSAHLNLYGFDPYKGVYHTLFFERKSLACDLMEPLRGLIDAKLRKMHNLGQINEKDFVFKQQEYSFKGYEQHKKYVKLLLEPIIAYKKELFEFVKGWYRMMMKEDRSQIPTFTFESQTETGE